ncbi:hypothetical protein L202_06913 [Cryptococcus amylolentus CBS 6039]|uniref:MutL C-terminal dimerisation domain-containing protein n=1 Tax=Cryptococcus amylolentus CBS 6039 TaxID=1295533 RepID=A0A1E3HDX7_9TREE|nr:hypothetical protein L202_06913 [Cryptococcus amylolentus CBS 6039]ODN74542.1 hypothetical protein L202_06913 [Cryptococcus amylolentus CBS 6039]
MPHIAHLPRYTSTTLRSSVILPSLPQILSELLQNSLDAGATKIDCYVDLTKGAESLRVEDDGAGIDREGLEKVGKRFRTSKPTNEGGLGPEASYGYRGEALASIASLSLLDITTKTRCSQVYTKILKHSKDLFFGPNASRHIPGSHGTHIVVRDIFHSIPVRRQELAQSSQSTIMGQIRKAVEGLILGSKGVRWAVWEERGGGAGGLRKVISIGETESSLDLFKTLYGSALVQRVQNIRVTSGKRRINGFISISGDVSKSHQHLYINNYPIDRGELHLAIAKRFANSRFSTVASAGGADEEDDYVASGRRSPRRLERHPVYVLSVLLPSAEIDVSYEPQKGVMGYENMPGLKNMLIAVVDEFLRRNGYSSGRMASSTPSPTKKPTSPLSKVFPRPETSYAKPSPLSISSLRATVAPTPSAAGVPIPRPPSTSSQLLGLKRHASPVSFSTFSTPKKPRLGGITHTASPRINEIGSRKSKWIEELLAGVETGVLPITRPKSALRVANPICTTHELHEDTCCSHSAPDIPLNLAPTTQTTLQVQFAKSCLSSAIILSQVDRKYIAAVLTTMEGAKALALIDQHAADERVSVEGILWELCEGFRKGDIAAERLKDGSEVGVVLTKGEGEVLRRDGVIEVFKRWGMDLALDHLWIDGDYTQIMVRSVPASLASRLKRKEAVEVTRLIRGYLPVLQESLGQIQVLVRDLEKKFIDQDDEGEGYGGTWGRIMRFMPKEMLELANSKACRGAIMFEDRLTQDQCSRLVHQLAQARFPFMCAHGRPAMVPLVVLTELEEAPQDKGRKRAGKAINWGNVGQRMKEAQEEEEEESSVTEVWQDVV